MPEQNKKPTTVRIELTDSQKQRVAEALEQGTVAAESLAIELSVEELEQRISPRLATN